MRLADLIEFLRSRWTSCNSYGIYHIGISGNGRIGWSVEGDPANHIYVFLKDLIMSISQPPAFGGFGGNGFGTSESAEGHNAPSPIPFAH